MSSEETQGVSVVEASVFNQTMAQISAQISELTNKVNEIQNGLNQLTDAFEGIEAPTTLKTISMTFVDNEGNEKVVTLNTQMD